MKNVRILLSSFAVVLAIGTAYATQSLVTSGKYEFIPASGGLGDQCISVTENCSTSAGNPCMVNMHEVRNNDAQTSCGALLNRQ